MEGFKIIKFICNRVLIFNTFPTPIQHSYIFLSIFLLYHSAFTFIIYLSLSLFFYLSLGVNWT